MRLPDWMENPTPAMSIYHQFCVHFLRILISVRIFGRVHLIRRTLHWSTLRKRLHSQQERPVLCTFQSL